MKIRITASRPHLGQEGINHLIGKEFEIVPYNHFDPETAEEMKLKNEVAIIHEGEQYIINPDEYEVVIREVKYPEIFKDL